MATLHNSMSVEVQDDTGVTTSMDFFYSAPDTITLADLNLFAAAFLPLLDAITDAQITKCTYKVALTLPGGLKSAPVTGSDVESTGLFQYSQATVPYTDGVDIAAISEAALVNGRIDLTNTDIAAFTSEMTTVVQSQTPESKFRYALVALKSALSTFRKHRKALARRTTEKA